jgi:uncharacterized protein YodC (DUF2158 family)
MTESKTPQIFKSGDIVKLKSGSPDMTVDKYHIAMDLISYVIDGSPVTMTQTTRVNVIWFEGDIKKKGQFEQSLLELVH